MIRTRAQRVTDARSALVEGVDVWVATASLDGRPHLVPLSFAYDDGVILAATVASSATARNVATTCRARLGFGDLRDVVMVDADAASIAWGSADAARTAAFVAARGWDPSTEDAPFVLLELRPQRVQVWRSVEELAARDVMRGGTWFDDGVSG